MEEPGGLQSTGLQRVGHDWATSLTRSLMGFPGGPSGKESAYQCRRHKRHGFNSLVGKIPWRRTWQLMPVFLPGKSHGQKSLEGYSPWACRESNTTERLSTHTWHIFLSSGLLTPASQLVNIGFGSFKLTRGFQESFWGQSSLKILSMELITLRMKNLQPFGLMWWS